MEGEATTLGDVPEKKHFNNFRAGRRMNKSVSRKDGGFAKYIAEVWYKEHHCIIKWWGIILIYCVIETWKRYEKAGVLHKSIRIGRILRKTQLIRADGSEVQIKPTN